MYNVKKIEFVGVKVDKACMKRFSRTDGTTSILIFAIISRLIDLILKHKLKKFEMNNSLPCDSLNESFFEQFSQNKTFMTDFVVKNPLHLVQVSHVSR